MRLIDADELIEIIEGSEELLDFQKDECIACIDCCDTAYDVEKVVEQLEEERKYSFEYFREDEVQFRKGLREAIRIIKKAGGTDER